MFQKIATALEIGSSKLKVVVGKNGINDTFNIIDNNELEYDGYFEGEFVDFDKLKASFTELFEGIDYKKKKYNKKLYVGLPAEFIGIEVVKVELNFDSYKKITDKDINDLFKSAICKLDLDACEVISTSGVTYSLDDGGRILSDPIGKKAKQISAEVSIVFAEKKTIQKLNTIFAELEFVSVEYVSETLNEGLLIIPAEEREHECLLIDVGHLSTSIAIIKGEGLITLTAYSLGGGYITGDLCDEFGITYKDSEKLKNQMVMTVKGTRADYYDLITNQGVERINLVDANKIMTNRVEEIGRAINQCVQNYSKEFISYLPTYLTGSGVTKLKGGKDYLSKCIGRNIILGVPELPGQDKPENSAILGILNYALRLQK